MRNLLLIFIASLLFIADVGAQATNVGSTVPCGMMVGTTGEYVVEPQNGDICPQDLAFQGSYLMFSEIFQDPTIRPLALLFVGEATLDSEFTKFADEVISVSKPIHFILSSVAILVWTLATAILTGKIYQYVSMVKKTGSFSFAESKGDTVMFIGYFTFLLTLLTPMGVSGGKDGDLPPLAFGQGLAVLASLPATMGGNYIYSTYLSATETASRDIPMEEDLVLQQSQMVSNGLIEGQLCMSNTQKATISLNAKAGSSYFKTGALWDSLADHEEFSDIYDNCLSYASEVTSGPLDESIDELYLNKYTASGFVALCNNGFNFDNDAYGYEHTCMKASFNFGSSKFNEVNDLVGDSWFEWDSGTDRIRNALKAPEIYPAFKRMFQSDIERIIKNGASPQETYEALSELFRVRGADFISGRLGNLSDLQQGTNDEKQARHLAAIGFLLGGSNENALSDVVSDAAGYSGIGMLVKSSPWYSGGHQFGALDPMDPDVNIFYGIDVLMKEAKEAADLAQQHYCATHWDEQGAIRKFIIDYNASEDSGGIDAVFKSTQVDAQCLKVLHNSYFDADGTGDLTKKYVTYHLDDDRAFADLDIVDGSPPRAFPPGTPVLVETSNYMTEEVAPRLLQAYQTKQFLLSGYQASVQVAVTKSLRDSLSTKEVENEKDIALRPKGWGIFGGALLYIGQTQNSAMHMARSFQDVLSVESGGGDDRLIERDAFQAKMSSEDEKNKTILELFGEYDRSTYFSYGPLSTVNDRSRKISDDEVEEEALQMLVGAMEGLLLSPMSHIKAASGMEASESLSVGLQRCFDDGYSNCMSGTKHPIVALSNFGHDMINNMIIALVTGKVLKVLDNAINNDDDDGTGDLEDKKEDKGGVFKDMMSKAKYLLTAPAMLLMKVAQAILTVAAMIFSALTPVFSMLLIVGIVFAYVIPMMAYIFGFMILALYWLGLFIVAVALPIYILLKLLTIEKDYQNGFKQFYQEILGVYATPIFFAISAVVSWSIIVIMMYAINISFAVLHAGLSSGASLISSLVINVFMYIVYFTAIFVLFRFGLGIMKDMPDTLREKVNMKRSGDDDYINSLGFEQYVQTQVSKAVVDMPAKMSAAIQANSTGGAGSFKALQAQVDQAEDVANRLDLAGLGAEEIDRRATMDAQTVASQGGGRDDSGGSDNPPEGSPSPSSNGDQRSDGPPNQGPSDNPESLSDGRNDGELPSFEEGTDKPTGDSDSDTDNKSKD
jgi:hypothetical protein